MRYVLSLMAVLLITATAAMPQFDDESSRKSLRGLIGVYVVVEDLTPEAEADGLWRTAIQTDVELKLRQAGIKVLTQAQFVAAPGGPLLDISVSTHRGSDIFYAFHVDVELIQAVRLERGPSMGVFMARTWEAKGMVGTVGRGKLQQIRDNIKDTVDQFVNAWLAVNPK